MNAERKCALLQKRLDHANKRNAVLVAEVENLKKENETLNNRIAVLDERAVVVEEAHDEYRKGIEEIRDLKEKYSQAIQKVMDIEKKYDGKFKEQVKRIRKQK